MWNGFLWLFKDCVKVLDVYYCSVGCVIELGMIDIKWIDFRRFVFGFDIGIVDIWCLSGSF